MQTNDVDIQFACVYITTHVRDNKYCVDAITHAAANRVKAGVRSPDVAGWLNGKVEYRTMRTSHVQRGTVRTAYVIKNIVDRDYKETNSLRNPQVTSWRRDPSGAAPVVGDGIVLS